MEEMNRETAYVRACEVYDHLITNHFVDVNKMVLLASGGIIMADQTSSPTLQGFLTVRECQALCGSAEEDFSTTAGQCRVCGQETTIAKNLVEFLEWKQA